MFKNGGGESDIHRTGKWTNGGKQPIRRQVLQKVEKKGTLGNIREPQ